jgi:hypothetical protein
MGERRKRDKVMKEINKMGFRDEDMKAIIPHVKFQQVISISTYSN